MMLIMSFRLCLIMVWCVLKLFVCVVCVVLNFCCGVSSGVWWMLCR